MLKFNRSSSRGFTLIEVLVALIFFSLIGVVMQQVTASTVGSYNSIRLKMFSSWIAENKMAELRVSTASSGSLPPLLETKEDIIFAQQNWELSSKVIATKNEDIVRVELEVFLIDETDEKSKTFVLSGMVGRI